MIQVKITTAFFETRPLTPVNAASVSVSWPAFTFCAQEVILNDTKVEEWNFKFGSDTPPYHIPANTVSWF